MLLFQTNNSLLSIYNAADTVLHSAGFGSKYTELCGGVRHTSKWGITVECNRAGRVGQSTKGVSVWLLVKVVFWTGSWRTNMTVSNEETFDANNSKEMASTIRNLSVRWRNPMEGKAPSPSTVCLKWCYHGRTFILSDLPSSRHASSSLVVTRQLPVATGVIYSLVYI